MITFLRHGETATNRAGLLQGHSDAVLTDLGRAQVASAAAAIALDRPRRLLVSPLPRTLETASIVAEVVGIDPEPDERLIELDYGEWEGRAIADIGAEEWRRWRADPGFAPPGGESLAAVRVRIAAFCEELAAADRSVVAVSHVSPIKAAVAWALGCDDSITWRMHLSVASLTRVDRRGSQPVLVSFNETAGRR